MLKKVGAICAIFFIFLCGVPVSGAQQSSSVNSPVGLWRTYDLEGHARSIIRFSVVDGKLQGQITKILSTKDQVSPDVCSKCPPPWKNKPKVGMVVVWGLKQSGDEWLNGTVLDTDSGNTYRCQISLSPDKKTMHFKAYVAVPLLGKTVNWTRE